jgi:hypothetical protein
VDLDASPSRDPQVSSVIHVFFEVFGVSFASETFSANVATFSTGRSATLQSDPTIQGAWGRRGTISRSKPWAGRQPS